MCLISRYVRPRRRSSPINSVYGSKRDRGGFSGRQSEDVLKLVVHERRSKSDLN